MTLPTVPQRFLLARSTAASRWDVGGVSVRYAPVACRKAYCGQDLWFCRGSAYVASIFRNDDRRCLPSCRSRGGEPPLQVLKEGRMNRVRPAAARTYRILIRLFAAAVIVEVFLAGLGIFGAMPGKNEPVSHQTFGDKFGVHAAIGGFLTGVSLLLVIAVLIAWTGLRSSGVRASGPDARRGAVGRRGRRRAGCRRLPRRQRRSGAGACGGAHPAGVGREPADPFRTAAAHCAGTGACCVDAGSDADTGRAGRVRRLRT